MGARMGVLCPCTGDAALPVDTVFLWRHLQDPAVNLSEDKQEEKQMFFP